MDSVALTAAHTQPASLIGMVQVQSLLESMKEIYGWLMAVSIVCLIALMLRYSGVRPMRLIEPAYSVIYRLLRRDLAK